MRKIIAVTLGIAIGTLFGAVAANAQAQCAPIAALHVELEKRNFKAIQEGTNEAGSKLVIYTNSVTYEWAAVSIDPNGVACVRMIGKNWGAIGDPA